VVDRVGLVVVVVDQGELLMELVLVVVVLVAMLFHPLLMGLV